MKILHLTFGLSAAGQETMLVEIANRQAAKGHKVGIIVINDIIYPELRAHIAPQISVIALKRKVGSKNPMYLLRTAKAIRDFKPDVIHMHHVNQVPFVWLAFMRQKTCLTIHHIPKKPNRLYSYPRRLFAISEYVRQAIFDVSSIQAVTIPNGIDIDAFTQADPQDDSSDCNIIQIGRLKISEKGQDLLLRAFNNILPAHPKATLTFVGEGPDRQYLENMAAEMGIMDNVVFAGVRSNDWIRHNLYRYSLMVHNSRHEGFGLILVEAMAARIPLLVADQQGPGEVVDHGKYGMTCRPEDVDDLTRRLAEAIDTDHARRLVAAAYAHAKANYDINVTTDRYLEAYSQLNT
ncbi:MAG: glycosyltransferase [Muribaculaceae bacterium]|nr:glycosyltransferase [Muribaculaceae bacterium]